MFTFDLRLWFRDHKKYPAGSGLWIWTVSDSIWSESEIYTTNGTFDEGLAVLINHLLEIKKAPGVIVLREWELEVADAWRS